MNYLRWNIQQLERNAFTSLGYATIWEKKSLKWLGIFIDSNLSFDGHVKTICKRASLKLPALLGMASILPKEQCKLLVNKFFDLSFNYRPLLCIVDILQSFLIQ